MEWADHGVQQHWFSTVDFDPPSLPNIWAGLKVIDLHKKRKESVYVHCKTGMGRSAVATVCYLIRDPPKRIKSKNDSKVFQKKVMEYLNQQSKSSSTDAATKELILTREELINKYQYKCKKDIIRS
eukprot:Em0008g550a